MSVINIAIDGPAGAGKSTAAKAVALKLGIVYVDTGAMYRALALKAVRLGTDPADEEKVLSFLPETQVDIAYENGSQHIFLDGEDVTAFIRTEKVSQASSVISTLPCVRKKLTQLQRKIARSRSVVMDGRDIGTVVLPGADYKYFITAGPEERAKRRYLEYKAAGKLAGRSFEDILKEINIRDHRDSHREAAPLRAADDAFIIDTSDMGIDETVQAVLERIKEQ